MKLVLCTNCHDIFKLAYEERCCECGICGGIYVTDLDARYWGEHAIPIGFNNRDMVRALRAQPDGPGLGERFEAFIIPKVAPTMVKIDHEIKVREPGTPSDVHTEHCCVIHGCKYGHDTCTVVTGEHRQSGPCEECGLTLEGFNGEQQRRLLVSRWPNDASTKEVLDERIPGVAGSGSAP